MDFKFKVCVRCHTYNQAKYIEDTLNGFCMQKTSFPFVCIVVDDASIDGEQDVIARYMEKHFCLNNKTNVLYDETEDYRLVFAQHCDNKYCFMGVLYLKYNHYQLKKSKLSYLKEWIDSSEYLSSCEGDDYWICPTKLQQQVSYLESHPDCSAVFGDIVYRNETKTSVIETRTTLMQNIYTIKDVYKGKVFPLNSICVRCDVWRNLSETKDIKANGDMKIAYTIAKSGYVYKINDFFSVYRKTGKGLSSQWNAKEQFVHDINDWYDFFQQLGFPDKNLHSKFQIETAINYLFTHGLKGFPLTEVKRSIFVEKWYIYIGYSILYIVKYWYIRITSKIRNCYHNNQS